MNGDKTGKKEKADGHKLQNEDYTSVDVEKEGLTHIANAHASGLGAMGRNDEKLPTGEEHHDPEEPVY